MSKINITVDEATELLNIGRANLVELIESDETFPCFAVGRKILIPVKALEEWANNRGRLRVGVRTVSRTVQLIRQRRRVKEVSWMGVDKQTFLTVSLCLYSGIISEILYVTTSNWFVHYLCFFVVATNFVLLIWLSLQDWISRFCSKR